MKRLKRTGLSKVVVLVVVLGIGAGLFLFSTLRSDTPAEDQASEEVVEEERNDNLVGETTESGYPEIYDEYGLPMYPNATVTYDTDPETDIKDGTTITVRSDDDIIALATFFASEMAPMDDWQVEVPESQTSDPYIISAAKQDENMSLNVHITKQSDTTVATVQLKRTR